MQVRARELIAALERVGWYVDRQRGSHVIMKHLEYDNITVSIPFHGGRTLPTGTLHKILKSVGLRQARLRELL